MKKRLTKKLLVGLMIMAAVLGGAYSAFSQDKVVVIPLNSKSTSSVSFDTVSHMYSIPGTSFLPISAYGSTEGDGLGVSRVNPGIFVLGAPKNGVAHNLDGLTMTFTAPVHLPDGANIGHIGAAICGDASVTDHDIDVNLVKTDMTTGSSQPPQTVVRTYNITAPLCGTSLGSSGIILLDEVDNSKYYYELQITGIEGGTCSGFPATCDSRRTQIQFAHISYSTSEVANP